MKTKVWDDFRQQYNGIIKNLLNNIDICNRRYIEEGEEGYMFARAKYIEELEELKTFIKKEEARLGYYEEIDEDLLIEDDFANFDNGC